MITVRELAAWPFDPYLYRPAAAVLAPITVTGALPPADLPTPPALADLLTPHSVRPDLVAEMQHLPFHLGLINLLHLQSFQRRLTLPVAGAPADNWPALVALNFALPRPPLYTATHDTLTTTDPNLTLSLNPLRIHTGSPFFEVATYQSRWFLRDGYHRAYALLRAGITQVPAVILAAQTLYELNGDKPHFFPEAVLRSPRPPLVSDFLDDTLNITYTRPPIVRRIRVTVETGEPL